MARRSVVTSSPVALSALAALVTLGACRSVFGIDEGQPLLPDAGDEGGSSSGSDGSAGVDGSGPSSDASTDGATKDAGSGVDAGPSLCPSAAPACQPEVVVTGLLSPGELAVMGTRLAFREHAKIDGGTVSSIRVWDPAGTCKTGSCLPTVFTGKSNYTQLAANAAHLCYTSEPYASNEWINCVKSDATFTQERNVTNETWFFQADFVETDTLLYGAPVTSSTRSVRVLEPTTAKAPYDAVSGMTGSVEYVAAQPDPVTPWFGWVESAGTDKPSTRSVADVTQFQFVAQNSIRGIAPVADNFVWATMYELRVARYTATGVGSALAPASVVTCDPGTLPDYKSITRGGVGAPSVGAPFVVAIEGCDIPGSLGSKLTLYPIDNSGPHLLASATGALTSAVVMGDYVYYTVGRLYSLLTDVPSEQLYRVRYR